MIKELTTSGFHITYEELKFVMNGCLSQKIPVSTLPMRN